VLQRLKQDQPPRVRASMRRLLDRGDLDMTLDMKLAKSKPRRK
jgi:hypothetical protein